MFDLRKVVQHMQPNGCVLVFDSTHAEISNVVYHVYPGMLEAHRINGEFLNTGRKGIRYDLYLCLKDALNEEG